MAKILVTGGNGYIGSHTVVELLKQGHEVVIVDNQCNSKPYVQERIAKISGVKPAYYLLDICNKEAFSKVFDDHPDISGIIHFAAHLFVDESVSNPLKYYRNNLEGLFNLIELSKTLTLVNIVFSSSCTVYGNPTMVPIGENEAVKPALSPYGNTKQICEEVLKDQTWAQENMNVIALRYFNPIGAHSSGKIGEDPLGHHSHLVPIIAEVASGKRQQLMVYGNDYPTRDGTCVRDYVHVEDLANAHVLALMRMLKNKMEESYEVYNIGSGTGQTVLEVVKAFENATGKKVPFEIAPRRPGDVDRVFADISKAKHKLGWIPKKNIADMLNSALRWEQRNSSNE